jgi:hypothetical protein
MVRKVNRSVVSGIENNNNEESEEWVRKEVNNDKVGEVHTLMKWAKDVATKHTIVEGAFGEGGDVSEFNISSEFRVVIDEDNPEKFHSPVSPRFNLIDNQEVSSVVSEVMKDFNVEDDVYGIARDYSKLTVLDLYFDKDCTTFEYNPNSNQKSEKLLFGIEIRSAHDASGSLKVRPIVRNQYSKSTLRQHNWKTMRHVNAEFVDQDEDKQNRMYQLIAESIYELGYKAENLVEKVEISDMVEIDFRNYDFSISQFYKTWLPENTSETLVESAVDRSIKRSDEMSNRNEEDEQFMSAWCLISGLTYSLANGTNMSDGNQKDRYYKEITNALRRPQAFIDNTVEKVQEEMEEEDDPATPEEKAAIIKTEIQDF